VSGGNRRKASTNEVSRSFRCIYLSSSQYMARLPRGSVRAV
jgi:hypothetical protein